MLKKNIHRLFVSLQDFNLKADRTKVNFNATGVGAQGLKEYKFTLDLLNEIDVNKIKSVKTGNFVDIFLPKIEVGFWSRLVSFITQLATDLCFIEFIVDLPASETFVVENRFRSMAF